MFLSWFGGDLIVFSSRSADCHRLCSFSTQATAAANNCKQRFLTISTPKMIRFRSMKLTFRSRRTIEVFDVTVTGQIRGPELKRLMRYFDAEYDPVPRVRRFHPNACFRTDPTQGDFWWPHPLSFL